MEDFYNYPPFNFIFAFLLLQAGLYGVKALNLIEGRRIGRLSKNIVYESEEGKKFLEENKIFEKSLKFPTPLDFIFYKYGTYKLSKNFKSYTY